MPGGSQPLGLKKVVFERNGHASLSDLLKIFSHVCIAYIGVYEMSTLGRDSYHHGDLRDTLVSLALEALEESGWESISLRQLAIHAGVSGMAPYRHFSDKAALLEAVARFGFRELLDQLRAVDDPADPRRAIVAFGVVYVGFACARPNLFRLMFGGAPPTSDAGLEANPDTTFGLFSARVAQIAPVSDRQAAFLACWSMVHGFASLLVSRRIRSPPPDPLQMTQRLGEMILDGINVRPETPRT
jgi:AcrR family transcriptional regulator